MASIYIHIPFCKQACHYCNFHFSTSLKYKNDFLAALLKEIALRKKELDNQPIQTIYFGGGTPGLLSALELGEILELLRKKFDCSAIKELTVEMNPDDVTEEKMKSYKDLGIDRISLGVQSFFEEDLQYMNRSHNVQKAIESIKIIKQHFSNYTVDLIYGFPLLTNEKLSSNLNRLVEQNVPHISVYGMTVEPKTALASFIKKGKEQDMDSQQGAEQFEYIMDFLQDKGFEHYEISSYARKGYRAIHNSNYWAGARYVGFGPGAHSFDGKNRTWNISNNALYIKAINNDVLEQEVENLSENDMLNELVLLGLRVKEGIDLERYRRIGKEGHFDRLMAKAEKYIDKGLLKQTENRLSLSQKGKLFCDGISSELFVE